MTACSKTTGSGGRLHQNRTTGNGGRLHQKPTTGSGRDRCHYGGFLLRIMPPPWHSVPACIRHDIPQAGHSLLPRRPLQAGHSSLQQR